MESEPKFFKTSNLKYPVEESELESNSDEPKSTNWFVVGVGVGGIKQFWRAGVGTGVGVTQFSKAGVEFGVGVAEKATQLRSPGFIIANGLTIILLNSIFYPWSLNNQLISLSVN